MADEERVVCVGRPRLPDWVKYVRLRQSVLNLWSEGKDRLGKFTKWLKYYITHTSGNYPPSFPATSAVPMCHYGDKLNNGEAKCQIMARLIFCSRL